MIGKVRSLFWLGNRYALGLIAYAGIAGSLSAATEWICFYVSFQYVGSVTVAFIGFFFGTAANYRLSRGFVFRSQRPALQDLLLIYLASGFAFAANLIVFLALYHGTGIDVIASKAIGTFCGFSLNYLARQFYIFSRQSRFVALSETLIPEKPRNDASR